MDGCVDVIIPDLDVIMELGFEEEVRYFGDEIFPQGVYRGGATSLLIFSMVDMAGYIKSRLPPHMRSFFVLKLDDCNADLLRLGGVKSDSTQDEFVDFLHKILVHRSEFAVVVEYDFDNQIKVLDLDENSLTKKLLFGAGNAVFRVKRNA